MHETHPLNPINKLPLWIGTQTKNELRDVQSKFLIGKEIPRIIQIIIVMSIISSCDDLSF
jgi:hypothetical protein